MTVVGCSPSAMVEPWSQMPSLFSFQSGVHEWASSPQAFEYQHEACRERLIDRILRQRHERMLKVKGRHESQSLAIDLNNLEDCCSKVHYYWAKICVEFSTEWIAAIGMDIYGQSRAQVKPRGTNDSTDGRRLIKTEATQLSCGSIARQVFGASSF